MSRRTWLAAVVAGVVGFALAASGSRVPVRAQDHGPQLPTSCSSGEIVVATGSSSFECKSLREVLHTGSCNDGDFLTTHYDALQCMSPSSTPWGVRGLLPQCPEGNIVVSEGFGRWKCDERTPRH